MLISLIVAMDRNRGIGKNGALPWHLSADLKRFKALTMGHFMIMGRKTFDSIGKALPGRTTIIVTRNPDYNFPPSGSPGQSLYVAHSLDEALEIAAEAGETETFVIGGGDIFTQILPRADRIYLTAVHTLVDCDTFFPQYNNDNWRVMQEAFVPADEKNQYPSTYRWLERKSRLVVNRTGEPAGE
jgi:dihydrofolate reductase